MHQTKKTLLITGASGVLGRALIDELSPDFTLVALRHKSPIADPRVRELTGSLAEPALGQSAHRYERLVRMVDGVVHAAAATNWRAAPEQIRATNVDGTRAMLGFAEDAGAPLYYVSTAFVANPPPVQGGRFAGASAYISSKVEAEQLTRDSVAPTVVLRPSVLIGDSEDGRMAAFQGLHRFCGLVARGRVPLVACDENALTDVVPQDLVAAAMGRVIRSGDTGGEYWLTSGANAPTAGDVVQAARAMGRRCGLHPPELRFVAAEAVDRLLLPLLDDAIDPKLRQRFAELMEMAWLFQQPAALASSMAELGFAQQTTRAALVTALGRSMDFWARTKGLRPADHAYRADPELAS